MAVTSTTLNGAITVNDVSIRVASVTGFGVGYYIRMDNEWLLQTAAADATALTVPVKRGQLGTAATAHVTGINVVVTSDANADVTQTPQIAEPIPTVNQVTLPRYSYAAAGAISPTRGLHVIIGTSALAMTLAVPSKAASGDVIYVVSNGKAAHTLTLATAIGDAGAGYTTLTFPAGGQVAAGFVAVNGIWVLLGSPLSGTATNVTLAIS